MAEFLDNDKLFLNLADCIRELRLLLLTSLEKESAIQEFLAGLREKLDLDYIALYFANGHLQTLERSAFAKNPLSSQFQEENLDLSQSLPAAALHSGQTLFNASTWLNEGSNPYPRNEIATPISIDRRAIAALYAILPNTMPFSDTLRQFFEQVGQDLVIALINLKATRRLKNKLTTDDLTGLFNKHFFLDLLDIEIKRANRNGQSLGIVSAELDQVPQINMQHGQAGLEKAIRAVAQFLRKNTRVTDLLTRFSDTGFMLTLAGSDVDRALVVAEKFRQLIEENSSWEHGPLRVSVGVAAYPLQGCDRDELIFLAQQAAKLAQHGGGNQVTTLGSDSMKNLAFKALTGVLSDRDFETGPDVASSVATQLERVSSDPLFSSLVSQIVESLASAIDAKDHYTNHHSEEASVYAEALARACQFSEKQIEVVKMAAKLHDLGKIGVPEHLLQKSGPLDKEEFEIMKEHPTIGARILRPIHSLSELVPIIQCHHERWNGSGYPAGLQGEETPVEARLIGVIDSFHAIISERPYKKAMPIHFALNELRRQAGIIFDPVLVEKFCHLIETDEVVRMACNVEPNFDLSPVEA